MPRYALNINGQTRQAEVDADTPLLWVLRDELQLSGTKYGCGKGLCGACTVHVDGQAQRSCQLPVSALGSKRVTTIEGLHPQGLHPLQQAWIRLDVAQCGYCQCGQIMQAAALLKAKPKPTDAEIDSAMAGNLCRCGTHLRIRAAIKLVARGEGA
ncbi:(2Fe-2S)-binding protein [Roseateles toxinivorans]|uniref:Isoquinoline 1-oxidoreductase alpha subunit n=1 Tax=Roseateles toxinivorans TaxID=270368 RepID=A0A4R6Q9S8_9BURK|nr:(2Fe-2S)-binding protein [Roseateles toxinivorans]TDP58920.1 isoquinoline 1-oxidoreductase alpha subunit [Roseateles toxinivorans]